MVVSSSLRIKLGCAVFETDRGWKDNRKPNIHMILHRPSSVVTLYVAYVYSSTKLSFNFSKVVNVSCFYKGLYLFVSSFCGIIVWKEHLYIHIAENFDKLYRYTLVKIYLDICSYLTTNHIRLIFIRFLTIMSDAASAIMQYSWFLWLLDDVQAMQISSASFRQKSFNCSLCLERRSTDFAMNCSGFFLKISEANFRATLIGGLDERSARRHRGHCHVPSVSECRFCRSYDCNLVWREYRTPHSTQDTVDPP